MPVVRCPACQTVFRAHDEQLRAHGGKVRCGHCFTPFNALENEVDGFGEQPSPTPRGTPVDPAPQGERDRASVGRDDATPPSPAHSPPLAGESDDWDPIAAYRPIHPSPLDDIPSPRASLGGSRRDDDVSVRTPPPAPGHPSSGPARWIDAPPDLTDEPTVSPWMNDPASRSPVEPPSDTRSSTATDVRSGEPAAPELPEVFHSARRTPEDHGRRQAPRMSAGPATAGEAAPVSAGEDAPRQILTQDKATETNPPPLEDNTREPRIGSYAATDTASPPRPHRTLYARQPKRMSSTRRGLWALGLGMLSGVLAVQAAFVFRQEITRSWPELRPLYLAACAHLGCEVPLPRIAASIRITSSELESVPADESRFVLHARVRNQADFPQQYPHLELTLTDSRDRPIARRVLPPEEWASEQRIPHGLGSREEVTVELPFVTSELDAATGYRVYAFYP